MVQENGDMNLDVCSTKYWKIKLSPEQYYFGRCVIVLKRECEELSDLTREEFLDLLKVIKVLEKGIKKELGATMFNWTCLMNNAYKETNDERPQVHFHMRPRYKKKVKFEGIVFEDENFAHHYKRKIKKEVSDEVLQKIKNKIREMVE